MAKFAALALAFACTAASAQAPILRTETERARAAAERICRGGAGVDRCSEEHQRRVREQFGVRSVEEHREGGDQVYRVFYFNTHGDNILLIAFLRPRGRDPVVRVHYPSSGGARSSESIEAPLTQPVWDELVRRAAHFDRTFELRPGEAPEDRNVCFDGGSYRIEAVGRARGRLPAEIRRDFESACENGPGSLFAEEVARLALPLFAHCAMLGPDEALGEMYKLRDCRVLHGDRLAAAEVLNLADGFRFVDGPGEAHRIAGRFADEAAIDWNGERYRGPGHRADEFWMERLGEDGAYLFVERVDGETADRVRLTGALSRSVDTPAGRSAGYETARVEQVWVRDFNGDMRVESATVGPWEPRRPR